MSGPRSSRDGYSGAALVDKLGYRPQQRIALVATCGGFLEAIDASRLQVQLAETAADLAGQFDAIQVFVRERAALEQQLPELRSALFDHGMLWVSWPKRASGVPSDLTENLIRDLALAGGLVDVKVCAIDQVWSGLKLVVPRAARTRR
jgi:hypothetical protein